MMNVGILKEESRMSRLLKDERGMTLVELLATVVILAVIAGIGATAIGKVIQNSREDAGVSNVQQAFNAAKLYQAGNVTLTGASTFNLKQIIDEGYLDVAANTFSKPETVVFSVSSKGVLTVVVPAKTLKAGTIESNEIVAGTTLEQILSITRSSLFG